jgi:hypothetical protein
MILCRTTVLYLVSVSKGAFLIVMIHSYTPCNSGINFPTLPVMQSANLGMFWYSTEETESAVSVKVSHGFQKCYKCLDRGASTLESEGLTRAVHNPHTEMSTRVIRSRRVVVGSESSPGQSSYRSSSSSSSPAACSGAGTLIARQRQEHVYTTKARTHSLGCSVPITVLLNSLLHISLVAQHGQRSSYFTNSLVDPASFVGPSTVVAEEDSLLSTFRDRRRKSREGISLERRKVRKVCRDISWGRHSSEAYIIASGV